MSDPLQFSMSDPSQFSMLAYAPSASLSFLYICFGILALSMALAIWIKR